MSKKFIILKPNT